MGSVIGAPDEVSSRSGQCRHIGVRHHLSDHRGIPARGMDAGHGFLFENEYIADTPLREEKGRRRAGEPGADDNDLG